MKAFIDIGSNSVRMMIEKDGKTIEKYLLTTRLAEGKKDGFLCAKSSLRTLKGISEFVEMAKEKGANEIYAFATAAVRNSVNGKEFVDSVKNSCGIEIKVLTGEQEAFIGALGALRGKDGGLIDIGGGSTEIAVIKGGKTVYLKSLPFGAVVLKERFGENSAAMEKFLALETQKFGVVPASEFYAIGGTATSLAAICLKLDRYSPEKVDGYYFKKSDIDFVTREICAKTVEERKSYKSLQRERADIIHAGACVLRAVTDYLGVGGVTVSESDNLEGYALYLSEKL